MTAAELIGVGARDHRPSDEFRPANGHDGFVTVLLELLDESFRATRMNHPDQGTSLFDTLSAITANIASEVRRAER